MAEREPEVGEWSVRCPDGHVPVSPFGPDDAFDAHYRLVSMTNFHRCAHHEVVRWDGEAWQPVSAVDASIAYSRAHAARRAAAASSKGSEGR